MHQLIGRSQEKARLENALRSKRAELIAIYGRRRVGKTFLVRQTCKDFIQFELTGLYNGTLADQLENFHHALLLKGIKLEQPTGWLQAFNQLGKYIDGLVTKKKKVIFLDEFPWMAGRRSKFLMAFENFWNSYASKRKDLVVVICGSAASYMVRKIVRNKGGLHNRITEKIRLLPFSLCETKLFLESRGIQYSNYDILRLYMAIGGIPNYLEKLRKGDSVAQALDRLCFVRDAPLRTEFKDIFASLFDDHDRHQAVIKALAASRKGLTRSEISAISGIATGGRLTLTLEELEESGFIETYQAFKNRKKDAQYRLNDEYSLFYVKFIERSTGKGTWLSKSTGRPYAAWLGFTFETACLKHVEEIKFALGISGVSSENYSWLGKDKQKGAQVDLLIDRADNVINLCEMKFYSAEYSIDKAYAHDIRNKVNLFKESTKTRKNVYLTMVTTYGVKQNQYSLELVQKELTIDCLFNPLP